jgi:hypothetical protein
MIRNERNRNSGRSVLRMGVFLNDLLQRNYVKHVQDTKIVPLTSFNKYVHNE